MRLTPAAKAQSPSAFIEAGWARQASVSSEVKDSAATTVLPPVWAIPAASTTAWAVLKPWSQNSPIGTSAADPRVMSAHGVMS